MPTDDQTQDRQDDQRDVDQTEPTKTDTPSTDELGDKGKEALRRERELRKQAEREAADLKRWKAEQEQRAREAEEAKAKEDGKYKELLEAREAELAELRQREQEREIADKRRKIAKDAGLAEELADRIVGTTDEEMAADAKRLATFFHREDGPDTDSGKRSASGKGTPKKDSLLASYEFGKRR